MSNRTEQATNAPTTDDLAIEYYTESDKWFAPKTIDGMYQTCDDDEVSPPKIITGLDADAVAIDGIAETLSVSVFRGETPDVVWEGSRYHVVGMSTFGGEDEMHRFFLQKETASENRARLNQ